MGLCVADPSPPAGAYSVLDHTVCMLAQKHAYFFALQASMLQKLFLKPMKAVAVRAEPRGTAYSGSDPIFEAGDSGFGPAGDTSPGLCTALSVSTEPIWPEVVYL